MDGVNKANSGHPGAPMGQAPMGYVLFGEEMNYTPENPDWVNRDRFVLSSGHGSMLAVESTNHIQKGIILDKQEFRKKTKT